MSFSSSFDKMVHDFCRSLSIKYNLNEDDLYTIWSGATVSTTSTVAVSSSSTNDPDTEITREKIMSATKEMLAAMCKKKGLKQSGKKEELYQRLIESISTSSKAADPKSSEPKKSAPSKKEEAPLIKSIKERTAELAIRKNKHGNFEHVQTGLIFNTDKLVYGKQLENGTVVDLTSTDVETCKKYKFPFKIPENLNSSKNMDDVKIDEIDEELLDEEDLDEDLEEEEEDDLAVDEDI